MKTTTPASEATIAVLGSIASIDGLLLTTDELEALARLYKIELTAACKFRNAGSQRELARQASRDGLRIVAWLAKYLESQEDPLKIVVELAEANGYSVSPEDGDWARGEI